MVQGRGREGDKGIEMMASSPYLSNLKSLDIGAFSITENGVKAICEGKNLKTLKNLGMEGCKIGEKKLEVLVGSKLVKRLSSLNVADNDLRLEEIENKIEFL